MYEQAAPIGANWFTNLSDFQVEAINGLNIAIRDDEAVSETHHTQFCLIRMGLSPMVKAGMLKKLISVCRGSDLAFLYFLLEACYKGAGFKYSERIIMSAITYLDLEMTMRELDRILPPGVEPPKKQRDDSKPSTYSRPSTFLKTQRQSKLRPVRSPYFMPLPKPKMPPGSGKNKDVRPPRLVVSFPFWPAGEPPNYKVNDESRWFANFKFQPVRRMLLEVVGDIMTKYWTQVGGSDVNWAGGPLCKLHQEAQRQEKLVKEAALAKAHKLCLSLVDITTRQDAALRKRIIAQLEKEIEDCTKRWERLRQRHLTDVMLLEDHDQMCAMGTVSTAAKPNKMKYLFQEEDIARLNAEPTLDVHLITGHNTVSQLSTVQVSDPSDDIPCPLEPVKDTLAKCPLKPMNHHLKSPRYVTSEPVNNEGPNYTKKGRFFKKPEQNAPFMFHYREIQPKETCPAPRDVMRRQVIRSLRDMPDNITSSEDGYNERLRPRDQVVDAIVQCAKGMWFGSLEAHQRSQASIKSCKSTLEPIAMTPCIKPEVFDWSKDIQHFDPDDSQLMERLLRDAFDILRRDPRCVFAAFPNAHKSKVMLEWIKRRYGKTYSLEEIEQLAQQSLPTFRQVDCQLRLAPIVNSEGLSTAGKDTYADHKRLLKVANKIKANYRGMVNDKVLRMIRACWKAMQPHLFTGSSVLNSFFAYLPVRYADMLR